MNLLESVMYFLLGAAITWVVIGVWMVIQTKSRGWRADLMFVFTWPIHWLVERGFK